MSVYNRKGGSGKTGSLRQQFNYYKRQLRNRLIEEQAFKEARGVGTIEERVHTMFKNVEFEQVFKQGITRKVGSKTVRFVGSEAVKIQISSFRQRASKTYQADLFISNYIDTMIYAGFDEENIDKVEKLLNSCSIDRLTYLIDKGILPSIEFLYADVKSEDKIVEDIEKAIRTGVSKEELDKLRAKKKALVKVIKEKTKIMEW